ncbi:hypothetical protein GHI93_00250 [Lactococcus hircilactis]|uniref:Uncharacterized protein n=1 Tax=Lactococcus hircilactis TaxID=1494462 RepID=A0A7X1Z6C6_9LACT|nr:hypothetical protein [Lactococcus hircilactis]MQW38381.1 hypothetical protein [Lactococcus hircilactis]
MEIRIYKDGAKTGKTTKLVIAGFLIAAVIAISAYALIKWKLPFLEVQTFTIIAIFSIGISTFGRFKGLPLWQFFYLALKFRLTINHRTYKIERKSEDTQLETEKTKKSAAGRPKLWRKTKDREEKNK